MLTPVGHGDALSRVSARGARPAGAHPRDPYRDGTCPGTAHRWRAGRQPLVAMGVLRQRPDRARGAHLQHPQAHGAPGSRRRAIRRARVSSWPPSGFGLFLYALSEAATLGWTRPFIVDHCPVGAVLIAALVWVELHADAADDRLPVAAQPALRGRQPGVALRARVASSGCSSLRPSGCRPGEDCRRWCRARAPHPRRSVCSCRRNSSVASTRSSDRAVDQWRAGIGVTVATCVLAACYERQPLGFPRHHVPGRHRLGLRRDPAERRASSHRSHHATRVGRPRCTTRSANWLRPSAWRRSRRSSAPRRPPAVSQGNVACLPRRVLRRRRLHLRRRDDRPRHPRQRRSLNDAPQPRANDANGGPGGVKAADFRGRSDWRPPVRTP